MVTGCASCQRDGEKWGLTPLTTIEHFGFKQEDLDRTLATKNEIEAVLNHFTYFI